MPIRLRLAIAFGAAAAAVFALGGWLFISSLSSTQLAGIDSQLAVQLTQAGRYLAAGSGSGPAVSPAPGEYTIQVIDPAGRVRGASPDTGTVPLLTAAELLQARQGQISLTQAADEEPTRIMAGPLAGHPGWAAVAGLSLEDYEFLGAIGFYYRNFNQVADEEVIEMLKRFPVTKLEQAP